VDDLPPEIIALFALVSIIVIIVLILFILGTFSFILVCKLSKKHAKKEINSEKASESAN
jgi:positive regulator of sigma E activity